MDDPYNWRGNSMDEIYRGMNPFELQAMPPIQCSNTHKVLFEFPITGNPSEPPTQRFGKAKWDYDHVRLPCAEQSTIIIDGKVSDFTCSVPKNVIENNFTHFVLIKETKRWEVIETALLQPISSIAEFEAAILKYNPKYVNRWKFNALHDIFGQVSGVGYIRLLQRIFCPHNNIHQHLNISYTSCLLSKLNILLVTK